MITIAHALVATLGLVGPATQDPAADPFPPATPESQGISAEALQDLAKRVAGFAEKKWVVGAELLVIKNRRTVLHEAVGWRDRDLERPMVKHTIFNLRSMTKPLVGAAAQVLIERGDLSLDDPVAKYLPSFAQGASAGITVQHLLTHRSGLPDGNPAGSPEDYDSLRSVADYWGGHGPSESPPGQSFLYSDPGADVLAVILAEVSGQPLELLVQEEVLGPLGMVDTFAMTSAEDPRRDRISSNYVLKGPFWERYWQPGDPPLAPFVVGSGTTWYGTPQDYARFLAVWMDQGRLGQEVFLSPETVARVLGHRSLMTYKNAIPGLHVRYGEMMQVYVGRDTTTGGEGTRVRGFGHSGSDGTYSWAFPDEDLMILYFTQSRGQRTRLLLEPTFQALLEGEEG